MSYRQKSNQILKKLIPKKLSSSGHNLNSKSNQPPPFSFPPWLIIPASSPTVSSWYIRNRITFYDICKSFNKRHVKGRGNKKWMLSLIWQIQNKTKHNLAGEYLWVNEHSNKKENILKIRETRQTSTFFKDVFCIDTLKEVHHTRWSRVRWSVIVN